MNKHLRKLARQYAMTLGHYLADAQEAVLAEAYELGRLAIARGLGVLDMARVHEQALEAADGPHRTHGARVAFHKSAHLFFLEALSPFEVTHRGFRETNVRLQEVIATLEKRNLQLAGINRQLQMEISERRRTEKALRESEQRLRALFDESRRMQDDLRSLSNQILHAQEEERKRISRELHDDVGQGLLGVSVTLAGLEHERSAPGGKRAGKIVDAQRLLQQTMKTVHDFARELRPAMLDELGLLPALRSYLKDFAGRTGLHVQFRGSPAVEALDGQRKTVLYRVAQESLTNVAKHAHASRVAVTLGKVRDAVCMEIADNGRSFHGCSGNLAAGARLGLLGMQERVRLVNGRFTITPRPAKGTTVRVAIPCGSTAAAAAPRPAQKRGEQKTPPPRGSCRKTA